MIDRFNNFNKFSKNFIGIFPTNVDEIDIKNISNVDITKEFDMISLIYNGHKTEMKIGRFISLFTDFMVDKIEVCVNQYKANYKIKFNLFYFEIVEGEDIRHWYLCNNYKEGNGQLNKSCMRYDTHQSRLDIYVENPKVCKLLIMKENKDDDKIIGRSLVWDSLDISSGDEVKVRYMDRVYYVNDEDRYLFEWYSKKEGWKDYYHKYPKMIVRTIDKEYGEDNYTGWTKIKNEIPYMDTFIIYYPEIRTLSTIKALGYIRQLYDFELRRYILDNY